MTPEIPQRYETQQTTDILQIEANPLYFNDPDLAQKAVEPLNHHIREKFEEKNGLWGKTKELFTGSIVKDWKDFFSDVSQKTATWCNKTAENAQADVQIIKNELSEKGISIVDDFINENLNKAKFPSAAAQDSLKDI